jgi:hypothetical protein
MHVSFPSYVLHVQPIEFTFIHPNNINLRTNISSPLHNSAAGRFYCQKEGKYCLLISYEINLQTNVSGAVSFFFQSIVQGI